MTYTLLGRQKINNYPDIPIHILCNNFIKHFSDKLINTCNIIYNKRSQYSKFNISFSLHTTVEIYNQIKKTKSSFKNYPLPLSSIYNN